MERTASVAEAKELLGENFIGIDELRKNAKKLGIVVPNSVPAIPYTYEFIKAKVNDYVLILGVNSMENGKKVTIQALINQFGSCPEVSEPCFYNQDWYLNENFIHEGLSVQWYFVRKYVHNNSRGVSPDYLEKDILFPSAVLCTFTFFVAWFCLTDPIWLHDFIWCNDRDHNGDRIYIGKYEDVDGLNKSGFSIHRHLALRSCYGSIDYV